MAEPSRPEPMRNSTGARALSWKPAALGVLFALAGGLAGCLGHSAWVDWQIARDQATAAGELPAQQPQPVTPPKAPAPTESLPAIGEAFVERFDGDVGKRWNISDGWSNGEWMTNDWRRSSVEVNPGALTVYMKRSKKDSKHALASGELQTHERHRYGYFEVQMKAPKGPGVVTGFFTYAGHDGATRPNEIDIEILGRNTRVAELTIHENGKATATKVALPFDAAEGFHVYGFEWQPSYVRWYVDGQLIHEEAGDAVRQLVRPQQLILNLWASRELDDWLGKLDPAKAPWRLDVSCMAYAARYEGPLCG